ncbi:MAG TPA: 16S rRNA processing protein RimM [Clostridiaceae bacterium]|nr:16S rRNA processing protein RimM [Clostridiaceae bacterium]
MNEYLAVGKVVNTHGVRGELKVMPMTSDLSRFEYLFFVTVNHGGDYREYRVQNCRIHKNFVLVKLKGIENMNEAEKLKGLELLVHRKHAKPLEEDEFYICDIIGMEVYEGDTFLGILTDVLETGSNDVYIITDKDKNEILLPALKSVVEKVDLEGRRMQVKIPEGLLDEV